MKWLFLSLSAAFFAASMAALSKIILRKKEALFVLWITYAFALPILLVVLSHQPRPHLTTIFWKTIGMMIPLEIVAFLTYFNALKISPLSLAFPFLGLTPAFTILTSSIMLNEKLPAAGVGGVLLVSLGAYLLNIHTIKDGLLAPIKNIYKEKGCILMILVAIMFSVTSVLGKKAVLISGPMTFPGIYCSIFFAILTPIAYIKLRKTNIVFEKNDIFLFIALGILFGTSIFFHYTAISLTKASYMISVKRLSLLISVLYGAVIFKEKYIAYRMIGASVMLAGVLILTFAG